MKCQPKKLVAECFGRIFGLWLGFGLLCLGGLVLDIPAGITAGLFIALGLYDWGERRRSRGAHHTGNILVGLGDGSILFLFILLLSAASVVLFDPMPLALTVIWATVIVATAHTLVALGAIALGLHNWQVLAL